MQFTKWEFVLHLSPTTWLFGYQYGGPGSHIIAFGPVGLELRRAHYCAHCTGEEPL